MSEPIRPPTMAGRFTFFCRLDAGANPLVLLGGAEGADVGVGPLLVVDDGAAVEDVAVELVTSTA